MWSDTAGWGYPKWSRIVYCQNSNCLFQVHSVVTVYPLQYTKYLLKNLLVPRGNGHQQEHGRFPLNVRKHFCAARVTELWLPRDCGVSSLGIFRSWMWVCEPALGGFAWVGVGPGGLHRALPSPMILFDSVWGKKWAKVRMYLSPFVPVRFFKAYSKAWVHLLEYSLRMNPYALS